MTTSGVLRGGMLSVVMVVEMLLKMWVWGGGGLLW